MRFLLDMDGLQLRLLLFCGGLLLYAGLSSPTPDHLGLIEAVIGVALVVSVGVSGVVQAFHFDRKAVFEAGAQALLFFGVSIPLLIGVLSGHAPGAVARDIIPFLFMMLPLLLQPLLQRRSEYALPILYCVVGVGLVLSVRSVLGSDPLYYLANMPSVLMAAIFLLGSAFSIFTQRFSLRAGIQALILIALAGIALAAMVETQQRASLGASVVAVILIIAGLLWRYPHRTVLLLSIVGVCMLPFMEQGLAIFEALLRKSDLVGMNMRFEELSAVWKEISEHPVNLLFGQGWGASFSSPAVADIRVYFTHSLFSSMLLKTGLVGLFLSAIYLYALLRPLAGLLRDRFVLVVALVFPVLIDVFLYASFKSLDFGLILLLCRATNIFERNKTPTKIAS